MKPYYSEAGIEIYHGNSWKLLPTLHEEKRNCDIWVLVTDPPYGVNLGKHLGANDGRRDHVLVKGGYDSYEDTPANFKYTIAPIIELCIGDMCCRGLVFCAGHMACELPSPDAIGGVFLPAACGRTRWGYNSFAHCLLYGRAPNLNLGAKAIGISSTETAPDCGHPCPKPIGWMTWAVSLASQDSDTILDPFMGSGTTLRAAKDLGRKAIGIEIEERYCEIAAKRLAQEVLAL